MKVGARSWAFSRRPAILATGVITGPMEAAGPLAARFDHSYPDLRLGMPSFEQAEQRMLREASALALRKAGRACGQVDFFLAGDLMDQITSSSFAADSLLIPYIGLFGACSTSVLGLSLAALLLETGMAESVLTATSSHNATVEKQFRYPNEYGVQKPPQAQYTVTAAAAALLALSSEPLPRLTAATIGRVLDKGVKDAYNMGAAMAPAAADSVCAHLQDLGRSPADYDLILTGDLGRFGSAIFAELMREAGFPLFPGQHQDCGLRIFDAEKQPVFAGGSGCGCAPAVLYADILPRMREGALRRVLLAATGALLSPLSWQQKLPIPGIAHALSIEI